MIQSRWFDVWVELCMATLLTLITLGALGLTVVALYALFTNSPTFW